jgi:hypothetical protein
VLVDPVKVALIINIPYPTTIKQLWITLVHTRYYPLFIENYASITAPLEQLLNKSESFRWTWDYDKEFDLLKEKLSTAPILTYPSWKIEFHVHIDASSITLGVILA